MRFLFEKKVVVLSRMIKVRRVGPARTNFADFEMGFFLSFTLSKGYYKKVKELLDYNDFEVFLGNPSHYKIKLGLQELQKKKKSILINSMHFYSFANIECNSYYFFFFLHVQII